MSMKAGFMARRVVCGAVALLALVGCEACGKPAPPPEPQITTTVPQQKIVIGRVPSGNVLDISERMEPLVALMKRELGVEVQVKFATDYAEFTRRMEAGEYDFAFCAPFQYITAHEKAGYEAILRPVRHGSDTYVGIIITAKPDVNSLADLKGKRIAFVDPRSTSGYLFPLGLLATQGLTLRDFESAFLKGHDNVVLNVLNRTYDAGACFDGAQTLHGKDRAGELRILARTEAIYNEPIAVSPKFRETNPELVEKVIAFLSGLDSRPEGIEAIARYGDFVGRFVPATDTDYNSVRWYREKLPPEVVQESGL
jgi:phosphonate transport system substrate-binding protein